MVGSKEAGADLWALGAHRPSPLQEQRSAVFLILFALITILILYSSNSANEVFHYGSLRGRTRRPVDLKKWSVTNGYIPILGNKVELPGGWPSRPSSTAPSSSTASPCHSRPSRRKR